VGGCLGRPQKKLHKPGKKNILTAIINHEKIARFGKCKKLRFLAKIPDFHHS
jgi:hypothetical protein